MIRRLALSGLFCAGKDWVANAAGYRQMSFAEPMYRISEFWFGHCDKTRADIRDFLQTIGQWGWGYSDVAESPCSPLRGVLTHILRQDGMRITGMKGPWQEFGKRTDFWVQILLRRLEDQPTHDRIAVTNMRFPHEQKPLVDAGFEQFLVLCSEETRIERNKGPIPPHLNANVSERFARELESTLPEHRIVWNDHRPMPEGKQYLTLGKFKELASNVGLH